MTSMRNAIALNELLSKYCNLRQMADIAHAANNGNEFCVYVPTKLVLVEVKNALGEMMISLKQNVSHQTLDSGAHKTFTSIAVIWVNSNDANLPTTNNDSKIVSNVAIVPHNLIA